MPILIQRLAVTATYDIEPDWWSIKPGIGFVVLDLSLNAKEGEYSTDPSGLGTSTFTIS